MTPHIPGKPSIISQNMPGAGSLTAANYIYNIAKPDGLTIGFVTPGLYFNQLTDMKEVKFDWAKFSWIGSPERTVRIIYGRSDTPYKTLDEMRNGAEQPRCGATALGTVGHYFPRLIEEVAGVRFSIVTGYPGAAEIDLAMPKRRSAVPRWEPGRLLRQRADPHMVKVRLHARAGAWQSKARFSLA
jgi:tripartite-type tricarboxylate transporter receptor subunit TctC